MVSFEDIHYRDPKKLGQRHRHHRQGVWVSNCSGVCSVGNRCDTCAVVNIVDGIGLVKLMGRSTGHITLHATLSSLRC
uniref:Uncharacterized protein n=1 Tax=Triticum urartu TaxID=4572 RepID=A0A8R7UTX4_TRIUA